MFQRMVNNIIMLEDSLKLAQSVHSDEEVLDVLKKIKFNLEQITDLKGENSWAGNIEIIENEILSKNDIVGGKRMIGILLQVLPNTIQQMRQGSPSLHSPSAKSKNNQNCFIATACYGSPDNMEVVLLRRFRDKRLLTSRIGSTFVIMYYHLSPPLAEIIRKSNPLRNFVRIYLIHPIVQFIGKICDI